MPSTALLSEEEFNKLSRAVADPTRFRILSRIAQAEELACAQLTEELSVTPATISHHIRELSEAGLVGGRKDGKFFFYSLRQDRWSQYLRDLALRVPTKK